MNNHAKKNLRGKKKNHSQRQTTYLNNQLRASGDFTLKTNFLGGGGGKRRGDVMFLRVEPVGKHNCVYMYCTRYPLSFSKGRRPSR